MPLARRTGRRALHGGRGRVAGPPAAAVRWWPLAAASALVYLLAGSGVLPLWPGLCHEVALPPLDLTSDVVVVTTRATSVWWFVLGVAAAVAGRSALLACMLGWSRRRLRQALTFYLVAAVPAVLAGALLDASQVVLYAAVFWVGLAVAVVATLVLAPLPWRGRSVLRGLADAVAGGARLPTVVAYLVVLAALGGAARLGGTGGELASVAVSAGATLVAARALAAPGARPAPVRLAAIGVALVALLVAELAPSGAPPVSAPPRAGSLFLVPGLDTSSGHGTLFRLDPLALGYPCADTFYFSYAGPGRGAPRGQAACPIRTGAPYRRADTERPLSELVAAFDAEVALLPAPVTVVTHSSASWVAWAAVSSGATPDVADVVMLSPLADPLGYPPPGVAGPNLVGGDGARLLTAIGRGIGFSTFRLDAPLATELLGHPARLQGLLGRALPSGVRALAVPAAYDLPLLVGVRHPFPHAASACPSPSSHSGLVTAPATAGIVDDFLAGRALPGCGRWSTWQGAVAAGFRAPAVPRPGPRAPPGVR